jgi:hypothetical protein
VKLKFNEDMRQYVPSEQLVKEFKGDLDFQYDHDVYWPALEALCREKHEARWKRWIAGGQQIGEFEDYLKGHLEAGVTGKTTSETAELAPAPATVTAAEPMQAQRSQSEAKAEEPKEEPKAE